MQGSKPYRPKKLTIRELAKAGVAWDGNLLRIPFVCPQCGKAWSPNVLSGGRMPKGYWHCPNKCNLR